MLQKARTEKAGRRKFSPPGPTFMTEPQMTNYLSDLRHNRPTRPSGSRPLPPESKTVASLIRNFQRSDVAQPSSISQSVTALPQIVDTAIDSRPDTAHRRTQSQTPVVLTASSRTSLGRPLVRDVSQSSFSIRGRKVSPTATVQVDAAPSPSTYRISGQRWMEREEAVSLRHALQEMDVHDEEQRIHDAAQQEASSLVWQHRNPSAAEAEKTAAYRNPDLVSNRFNQHLEKGAHARSQSQTYGEIAKRMPRSVSWRSTSDGSLSSNEARSGRSRMGMARSYGDDSHSHTTRPSFESSRSRRSSMEKRRTSFRRSSQGQRNVSSGSTRGLFRNPEDEIYEEPEAAADGRDSPHVRFDTNGPLQSAQRNSLPLIQRIPEAVETQRKRYNAFEIHQNTPSQSRKADYVSNDRRSKHSAPGQIDGENAQAQDDKEIRSEEMRAATQMKRSDRSPNLPSPSAVSDQNGRPIVSFDPAWQPRSAAEARPESTSQRSSIVVPKISISGDNVVHDIPTINLPGDAAPEIPIISVHSAEPPISTPIVQLPKEQPMITSTRPLPDPSRAHAPVKKSRLPWVHRNQQFLSRAGVPTATCDNCSLPIAGRVVTASGSGSSSHQKARFHPECFNCFHCSTSLEAAEFYPEPENKRLERLQEEGLSEGDDGTELRFYCHLDFHEFFSPRCRSCKTPIEGEVIIAAGGEWHVGHFFCAECGNPFDSDTPFLEKDGYACLECGGGFGDDGQFFVRDVVMELTEKERRRGLKPRLEERAVCEACEARRLKA